MWVVQSNFLDINQINPIVEALREYNIPFQDVGVIPFSDEFITPLETDSVDLIPYGSTTLMKLAEKRGWTGLFFDRNTFNAMRWVMERSDMLNADGYFTTVERAPDVLKNSSDDDVWFIRPAEDLKAFNGTVTNTKEIRRWMSSVESGNFSFSADTPIVIASPKEILMEWRYFVVDRKIVTGSSYKYKNMKLTRREEDPKVLKEAQEFANGWLPHETCVMDLALTPSGVKVVEFNCLNSSGFYYHDIKAFVKAVTEYANRVWNK